MLLSMTWWRVEISKLCVSRLRGNMVRESNITFDDMVENGEFNVMCKEPQREHIKGAKSFHTPYLELVRMITYMVSIDE